MIKIFGGIRMSFVAIDIGASNTRFVADNGQINTLPNDMLFLNDGEVSDIVPDKVQIEDSLEFTIKKTSGNPCEYFPVTALAGIMAERHDGTPVTPSVDDHKYNQRVNYTSLILACAVSQIKSQTPEQTDVFIAVPPIEIRDARKVFGEKLPGKYEVNFPKFGAGGTTVTVDIQNVYLEEESKMAVFSFFFGMNGMPIKEHMKYMQGRVLSIDIGASTIDLAIIDKGTYQDKSGRSFKIGGNVVRDRVMNDISAEYSTDLNDRDADRTITEGRLQSGNSYINVGSIVDAAKMELADIIVDRIPSYFKNIGSSLKMINAIVVSGGGSLQSQYIENNEVVKTSESLAYFITQKLLETSPNTEVVDYGEDARFANIKGLYILARVNSARNSAK